MRERSHVDVDKIFRSSLTPFWAAVKGSDTVYVSSERDREIVVVSLAGAKPAISTRIPVAGYPKI
jgi:hypothetical protein